MSDTKPVVVVLSEEQIEQIAGRVMSEARIEEIAKKVENRFLARVGGTVIEKFLWLVGFLAVCALIFFAGKGALPK